jgi:phage portal protein BeeE
MADIQTRWDAYRLGRQGGWITANEIRAKEGLEARPDGDEIQVTPVGGAANPTQDGGSTTNG